MSNINTNSIDTTYPVPGVNNTTQGFRDNFGFIKNSLTSAKSEITDLQNNTAKTNEDNSFNFKTISQAQLKYCGETYHDGGTITTDTIVSYSDGSIQSFKIGANLSLILEGFPPLNIVGKLRIHLTNDNTDIITPHTVTFEVQGGAIKKNIMFNGYTGSTVARTSNPLTLSSETSPVVIDFWTYDYGSTVFMNYVGQFA
jgi:hypothetical protein